MDESLVRNGSAAGAGFAPLSQLELPSLCADLHVDAVAKDFNASATCAVAPQ